MTCSSSSSAASTRAREPVVVQLLQDALMTDTWVLVLTSDVLLGPGAVTILAQLLAQAPPEVVMLGPEVHDTLQAAPLLARSFGTFLFSMISAIAFATVLGTVSGLIIAASGAVAHDLLDRYGKVIKNDKQKVMVGKATAFVVGFIAIGLGIIFKGVNVTFLVGLAFAVAASANLPSIVMMLFWKRTTSQGITASITIGIVSSVGLILFSPTLYALYGMDPSTAPVPLNNPGIISIPLSFATLVVVSLLSKGTQAKAVKA